MTIRLFVFLLLLMPSFAQQSAPTISFESVSDFPKLPAGMNFGEVPGVAVNSKGHVFVFTRSNSATGPAYGAAAGQLFEFTPAGDFVREIGKFPSLYIVTLKDGHWGVQARSSFAP